MKKFLVIMLAMLWMSVAAFSQITISQEDYDKLPNETRTQIEKITTEKAIKGEIKEVSEYANLGKEIGVAVNETLKAVEDSAIRIAESNLGQTAITIVVWKLLYKEIAGIVVVITGDMYEIPSSEINVKGALTLTSDWDKYKVSL